MTDDDWTSLIAGERMAVDKQFTDRIADSSFSNQQWGLVMTAIEFEITDPEDPESARLVADTSRLDSIMPELDQVGRQPRMDGPDQTTSAGGGFLDGVKAVLGLAGEDGTDERRTEAETLTQEYAEELQARLEADGRWESVCAKARN